jgi:putative salt-induced outer membrane protein YdiY
MLRAFVIVSILTVAAPDAAAGIVNVQSILAAEAPEGWSGSISGSADVRRGNIDLLLLGATPLVRYRTGDHLMIGTGRAELGRTGAGDAEATFIKKTFAHLRYRYTIEQWLLGEVFAQHEYDEFRRIELRALVGAGPKLGLVSTDSLRVGLGVAYMLEYERLDEQAGLGDSGADDVQHRASSYLTANYKLDDRVDLVNTFYAQPRLDAASDTRLLDDAAIIVKLTDKVAMTTSFTVSWDNRPPETVEKTDTTLKSTVTWTF